jgi:DNA topoisomerase-1
MKSTELESVASAGAAGLRYVNPDGPGISRRRAGKGFTYIGVDSKPVRNKGMLERIAALVIPPAWKNVWICPLASGHIQAVGRDARGRKQYRYHARYREIRDENKFGRMLAFGAALPKIRRRVAKDLALPELPERKVIAAIVRLLDETCIRVGNEEYAKANKSYGLTTLKDRHVRFHGDSLQLQFRGKSNQDHHVTLKDRRLAKIVKQCQDLPGQELFQYKLENGEYAKVDSTDVNDYLREIAGQDFTAKDFRTWHGSGLMAQQLVELGPAQSEKEAKRNIVAAVKVTASKLGNRPAACRKYYVHPAVFEGYREQTIFETMRLAGGNSGKAGSELRREELALMHLVKSYEGARGSRTAKAS